MGGRERSVKRLSGRKKANLQDWCLLHGWCFKLAVGGIGGYMDVIFAGDNSDDDPCCKHAAVPYYLATGRKVPTTMYGARNFAQTALSLSKRLRPALNNCMMQESAFVGRGLRPAPIFVPDHSRHYRLRQPGSMTIPEHPNTCTSNRHRGIALPLMVGCLSCCQSCRLSERVVHGPSRGRFAPTSLRPGCVCRPQEIAQRFGFNGPFTARSVLFTMNIEESAESRRVPLSPMVFAHIRTNIEA